jgi:hypothetical protein
MEGCFIMKAEIKIKEILSKKFDAKRVNTAVSYFISSAQKFEGGDWESSLGKAGKFIEAIIKLLWVYPGNSLPPKEKDFKATIYAQKIIDGVSSSVIPDDSVRLQIPRASIFAYGITSNRGGRHDSDEFNANEMDSLSVLSGCSWILSELFRFCAKGLIGIDEAKEIVDSLMARKYSYFEEIDGRIYVDGKKFKSATECGLLILYKAYPRRIKKDEFIDLIKNHQFKATAIKIDRMAPYIDVNENESILLRATGRRKAEEILNGK